MAGKSKTVAYTMIGKKTGRILGSGRATKDQIKRMNERAKDKGWKRYSQSIQAREEISIKAVKKGGTKALANAK